jgi:hypothetical protein
VNINTFIHAGCDPKQKDRTTPSLNFNNCNELRFDIDEATRLLVEDFPEHAGAEVLLQEVLAKVVNAKALQSALPARPAGDTLKLN